MFYSYQELADDYGYSKRTFERRVAELKENGKFKKRSKGKFLSEMEAEKIAKLIGFTIKKLQT